MSQRGTTCSAISIIALFSVSSAIIISFPSHLFPQAPVALSRHGTIKMMHVLPTNQPLCNTILHYIVPRLLVLHHSFSIHFLAMESCYLSNAVKSKENALAFLESHCLFSITQHSVVLCLVCLTIISPSIHLP